jgi:hypothetical protein
MWNADVDDCFSAAFLDPLESSDKFSQMLQFPLPAPYSALQFIN